MEQPAYPNYPELFGLKEFVSVNAVKTDVLDQQNAEFNRYIRVRFTIKKFSQLLWVDNEYKDFDADKPLLHAELCLQHLEEVEKSVDFLDWANDLGLNPKVPQLLNYFKEIVGFNDKIRQLFESQTIESFVLSFDFELNQKAAQALRNEDFE